MAIVCRIMSWSVEKTVKIRYNIVHIIEDLKIKKEEA